MAYTRKIAINGLASGLTLKVALVTAAGTIHATFRDIAAPAVVSGSYGVDSALWPDDYAGYLVPYTGTLGAATTFSGVNAYGVAFAVNPGDYQSAAQIKAKTDLIPAIPAAVGDLSGLATASALATVAAYVDTEVAAIKAKTDLIPASPAAAGDVPSAATIAAAAAAAILVTPAQKIVTDANGKVTTSNPSITRNVTINLP